MVGTLQGVKPHSWPGYAWEAEPAATLSLQGLQFGGRALVKTGILGQFMIVGSANLWLLSQNEGRAA
jgi:hypothetical protein